VHASAAHAQDTDWRQIAALYDRLVAIHPSPVVALNRAVAVAMADGLRALVLFGTYPGVPRRHLTFFASTHALPHAPCP
jgi:predicted RNA polymerase sigma factor